MSILLLSAILFSQAPDTTQPVVTWEPEEPAWGETVTFTYHHTASDAVLKGTAPIFAKIGDEVIPCERKDDVSLVQFVVPDSVPHIGLFFYSLEERDPSECGRSWVEINVPEGWQSLDFSLQMLRHRWFGVKFGKITPDELREEIDSLRQNPIDQALYRHLLTYGFLQLGEIDSVFDVLAQMREKDAGSTDYALALLSVNYDVHDKVIELDPEKLATLYEWMDEEAKRGNTDRGFLVWVGMRWKEGNTSLSLKERERILKNAVNQAPHEYWRHVFLADHYLAAGDTAKAEKGYSVAIDLILTGVPQKRSGEVGGLYERQLMQSLIERARIRVAREQYDAALADLNLAILFKYDPELEKQAYFEMGKVYQGLELYKRAEEAYLEAFRQGYPDAQAALRGIYLLNHGEEGFDEWLVEQLAPREGEELFLTKDFAFTTLEGEEGRWFDFRGKIVVVNRFGLGCGGIRAQIPVLNQLVDAYKGQEVEFVAFSGDGPDPLKHYLAEHPFKYRMLRVEGTDFCDALNANPAIKPWQLVIDPECRVRFYKMGGFADASETQGIKLIIDQLLREQK